MLTPPDPTPHPPDEMSGGSQGGAPEPAAAEQQPEGAPPPAGPPLAVTPPAAPTGGRRRRLWPAIVTALAIALIVAAATVQLPYYLFRPGTVRDTEPLISVEGAKTYASAGTISYTTVSLRQATVFGLLSGWLDRDIDVEPRNKVLGNRGADENRALNLQMMDTSKQVATQVALDRLGYHVDVSITGMTVIDVLPDMPADGVLAPGDTITAVDGHRLDHPDDLTRLLSDDKPGDDVTITVEPHTGAGKRDVELALAADPSNPRHAIMGVTVGARGVDYDFPVDVKIDTGNVGGPSAGLAFTLSLIDDLTPGDLTGGAKVAVTGTISSDGTVGPVGGAGQKAAAVRAGGYDVFLVPTADYRDATQHAGHVKVIAVDTLDEALAALGRLGGNVDQLPPAPASDRG